MGFFAKIPYIQIEKISTKLVSEKYLAGETIFKQGTVGNKMYIIS